MNEILVSEKSIRTMCRLCLSSNDRMIDIFKFSYSMENKIADVIMKCAPIQITERDELPNFICRLCYTHLEKMQQFQMQVVQSEKTLRRYLKQLHASNKQTKINYSIQRPSQDPLTYNSNVDITMKCESLEHDEVFDTGVNWKEKEFVSCNLEPIMKEEPGCDNSLIRTKCAFETETCDDGSEISCEGRKSFIRESENIVVDLKDKVPTNFNSANKHNWKLSVNSVIKGKPTNDDSLILTDYIDGTTLNDGSEISCENTKIDVGHTPTFCFADVMEYFEKREEGNKNVLENNLKKAIKMEMYKCKICDKNFTLLENFEEHKRLHACDKPCQCDVCNKYFPNFSKLNSHKLTHTSEKPYKCDVCSKCFNKLCNLKYHERIHTGEKPHRCDICNKEFSRPDSLNIHKRLHNGEKQYKCDICKKDFSKLCSLKSHNLTHTGEKPYQCDICNKSFPRSDALNTHKRAHTGIKPYKCDVCKKCFMHLCNLKTHTRIHTGVKPYQCEVCSKCFARSSDLKKHSLVHSGEKPHRCDICNKSFKQFYDLKTHKRTHTVEKLYQCDVCEKWFTRLNNLNVHRLTHTGEKPHQCDLCNKCFTHSNSLKIHRRTHTGEKPFQCNVCEKNYPQLSQLKFHKLKHS